MTSKIAIRRKTSFSLRVTKEHSVFAHGFVNEALSNPFEVYAFNVFFSYGIFGRDYPYRLFRLFKLAPPEKTGSNKAFSLPEIVKRAAKAIKNKKAETCRIC